MKRTRDSGSALVWTLIWLPVGLFAISGIFYLKAWIMPEENSLQICRVNLLQGLSEMSGKLRLFLDLNEQVIGLREQRVRAEVELQAALASTEAGAVALAEEQLQLVISQQRSLQARQQSQLSQLNQSLHSIHWQTQLQIQRAQQNWRTQFQGQFNYSARLGDEPPPQLAVTLMPSTDDGPPTYKLKPDFTEAQAVKVSWRGNMQSQSKGENPWQYQELKKSSNCAASLEPNKIGFKAVLMADKSSSSSCSWCR